MIKTILVPASGSSTDRSVFATALALARPLTAHLEFLHLHLTPGVAALHAPHVDFLQGPAVGAALAELQREETELSARALDHFQEFCREHRILIRDTPQAVELVSAHYSERIDQPLASLLMHTRHSDLVVLGRRRNRDFLQGGLIEELLARGGRPVVVATDRVPQSVAGTIVIGWKETAEAARAVGAAVPLLRQARRVVLLAAREEGAASPEQLEHLARELAWHGVDADVSISEDASRPAAQQLLMRASQLQADLLVVGAFGHGALRERVFGGVTRTLLEHADLPVFMLQ
ncbi:MAG TPA: universal stress protein [Candidatus Dormibacteraeota bacterium]|nr:universal stress protein [Candidatus Dormibacteraeota bacterium]